MRARAAFMPLVLATLLASTAVRAQDAGPVDAGVDAPTSEAPVRPLQVPRGKVPHLQRGAAKGLGTYGNAPKVRAIAFKLGEIDDDENASLQRYLADLIGKPATPQRLREAEQRLAALRRYERARCVVFGSGTHGSVVCDVWRARVLREVTVEGLPGAILETDLMKRVFLRSGEPLDEDEAVTDERGPRPRDADQDGVDDARGDDDDPDDDEAAPDAGTLESRAAAEGAAAGALVPSGDAQAAQPDAGPAPTSGAAEEDDTPEVSTPRAKRSTSRLLRQRQRIEDFLEREGFQGAEVRLLVKKAGPRGEHDVVIRVRGGSFVRVRNVDLKSFGPLPQRQLQEAFGRMCLTGEGLLDGVFLGNITSCFNKRRLQATIDRFTRELHALGYPEGRVRAEPVFIDPSKTDDEECADTPLDVQRLRESGLKPPPHCVDIAVEVVAGPKVTVRFHVDRSKEKPIADSGGFLSGTILWLRETFAEPLSRFGQIVAGSPPATALDTELSQDRLQERVSFEEAGAVDETEIGVTARNTEEYMAERGRIDPHVTVEERTFPGLYGADEHVIDFYAAPSPIGAVQSVEIVGAREVPADEILDEVELAAHPRSLQHSGALSNAMLLDDEERIRAFYADRGFPEATVQSVAGIDPSGNITVTFVIEEGPPFVLAGLVLAGGADALETDVVRAIRHCEGGASTRRKREPVVVEDCVGAPLRPDELDADAQRVQTVYASRGYPNVEASVETAFSPEGPTVRITVVPAGASDRERANPKPNNVKQVVLGEVFLEGARETRREVILREAGLDGKAGEPLDPTALGKGISRLRRTGLYDSVELEYLGLDSGSDHAHVRLALAERPAFTLDTSIGFSTEQLLGLRAELRHKNLLGSMLDASVLADFGLFIGRFSQIRTQLRWPRIFGTDITMSFVPLSVSFLDEPAGARLRVPSTTSGQKATAAWAQPDLRRRLFQVGGSLSFDWRLRDIHELVDDKLTLGLAAEWRYDWLNPAALPVSPFSEEAVETIDGLLPTLTDVEYTPVVTLTPRISYSNIDNPFDPKSGFGLDVFVRGSTPPLVRHGPFAVLGATGRGYYTLFERVTLAGGARTRLGFAATDDDCSEPGCEWALMQNDLLLLGGERSVRGVPENNVGVFGLIYDEQLRPVDGPDGGELRGLRPGLYSANVNGEVRVTAVRQLFIGELKPAVFFDAGVSTDNFVFELPDADEGPDLRYAWGFGAGLRYVIPVGPLALDFAYSPPRQNFAVYFSLGYAF
jgi:outer membrane protein assembly factor BamA